MLTKLRIAGFKSVRERQDVNLAPLTVVSGENSSGKSTLLQSLLLLAQTSNHSGPDRQLVLNGPFVRLGEFNDVASIESESTFQFGLEISPRTQPRRRSVANQRGAATVLKVTNVRLDLEFTNRVVNGGKPDRTLQTFPSVKSATVKSREESEEANETFFIRVTPHGWSPDRRRQYEGFQDLPDAALDSLRWKVEFDEASVAELRENRDRPSPKGILFNHFLPDRLSVAINFQREIANEIIDGMTSPTRTSRPGWNDYFVLPQFAGAAVSCAGVPELLFSEEKSNDGLRASDVVERLRSLSVSQRNAITRSLRANRSRVVDRYVRSLPDVPEETYLSPMGLPQGPTRGIEVIRDELRLIRYLGPLRVQPLPLYPVATTLGAADVGPSGEWTASVLDAFQDAAVTYISPNSLVRQERSKLTTATLRGAVDEWMSFLGVSHSVRTVDRGSLGHELTVSTSGGSRQLPLTHVGVGVSQCLPVVVALLLAPQGSAILLEQPELHLHPAVQSRLADFLLASALSGRQCIVETHSEHIINRLRRRVAEDNDASLLDQIAIYSATLADGQTKYSSVDVNEFGAIADWPIGFFDQAQDESETLLLAASNKRRRRKSQ